MPLMLVVVRIFGVIAVSCALLTACGGGTVEDIAPATCAAGYSGTPPSCALTSVSATGDFPVVPPGVLAALVGVALPQLSGVSTNGTFDNDYAPGTVTLYAQVPAAGSIGALPVAPQSPGSSALMYYAAYSTVPTQLHTLYVSLPTAASLTGPFYLAAVRAGGWENVGTGVVIGTTVGFDGFPINAGKYMFFEVYSGVELPLPAFTP